MDTSHIEEFILLAQTLNFTYTAKTLYTTTSTLSRHIASLEEELDVELIDRSNHNVVLTEAGLSFYKDANIVIEQLRTAKENIERIKGAATTLRLGYLHNSGSPFLPKANKILVDQFGMQCRFIHLDYDQIRYALLNKTIDAGILIDIDEPLHELFTVHPLATDYWEAIVSKDHPLAEAESFPSAAFKEEAVVYPSPENHPTLFANHTRVMEAICPGITPGAYYIDTFSLFHMVALGDAISISLHHHQNFFGDTVSFVPLETEPPKTDICLIYSNSLPATKLHALDTLAREYK